MTFDPTPLKHLYPFQSHHLTVDGHRYHYVDEGTGDPIICVHGNPTWSFYFRRLIRTFSDTHRVIAVDHIGCGLSDKPSDREYSYRLERRAADLEALIDHLELGDNLTFVMHDWGGMIGTAVALRRAESVKRLIYFNTAAFLMLPGKRLPFRLSVIRNIPPLAAVLVRGFNAFAGLATKMACTKRLPPDVAAAYVAPYDSWASRIATLRFVQDIPLSPGDPSYQLARWVDDNLYRFNETPTLICWGLQDFVFDADFLREWKRRMPNAAVHEFPDAGHYVLEDAWDEIRPIVGRFLEQHSIADARLACRNTEAVT